MTEPDHRQVPVLALRHGQSEWNALGRWQGHADIGLSAEGLRQAGRVADALAHGDIVPPRPRPWAAIWASDLRRAQDTALVMSARLGVGPVELDQRLRETHAGEWEGLTRDEIDEGWPGYLAAEERPPAFEPYATAADRFLQALVDAAVAAGGPVLVISHGGVIRAARRRFGCVDLVVPNMAGGWFHVDSRVRSVVPGELAVPLEPGPVAPAAVE